MSGSALSFLRISGIFGDFSIELLCHKIWYFGGEFFRSCLTFPYNDDFPAERLEVLLIPFVAFHIFLELQLPELDTTFRRIGQLATFVPVPVATVHEDHCLVFWKDDVRPAWQFPIIRTVHGESIAGLVEKRSNDQLGLGVPASNPAHVP